MSNSATGKLQPTSPIASELPLRALRIYCCRARRKDVLFDQPVFRRQAFYLLRPLSDLTSGAIPRFPGILGLLAIERALRTD